jgi:hypothetical protein
LKRLPDFRWSVRHVLIIREFKCSHDDVAAALGIEPTRIAHKGQLDPRYPRRPPPQVDLWSHELSERDLTTEEMNTGEVDANLREFVARLWDRRDEIVRVIDGAEVWMETIVNSDSPRVAWACDVEIMRRLSSMGIGWVVTTWLACNDDYADEGE